jgi:hypothetical protein
MPIRSDMPHTPDPKNVFVTFDDLRAHYGIPFNRPTLRKMMDRGEFPPAIMIGERSWAWHLQTILDFIRGRPVRVPEPTKASARKKARRIEQKKAVAPVSPLPVKRPRARFD